MVAAVSGAAFLMACVAEAPTAPPKTKRAPVDPGDDYFDDDVPSQESDLTPTSAGDSGAFGAPARPASSSKDGGLLDGGADTGPTTKVYCTGALKAGDLAIGELLISSRAGSNDDGEWVEIRSTRTCWLSLKGLVIESPRGTSANTATIVGDFELGPADSFVVADSADPAKNHGLTGNVFAWDALDVLKNDGDTISVKLGTTVIDTLTYPAFTNLEPGRTLAFPSDCPASVRSDWTRWSLTFDVWKPGFEGTPNAVNDDIACY